MLLPWEISLELRPKKLKTCLTESKLSSFVLHLCLLFVFSFSFQLTLKKVETQAMHHSVRVCRVFVCELLMRFILTAVFDLFQSTDRLTEFGQIWVDKNVVWHFDWSMKQSRTREAMERGRARAVKLIRQDTWVIVLCPSFFLLSKLIICTNAWSNTDAMRWERR